jgi:hypothetical protein
MAGDGRRRKETVSRLVVVFLLQQFHSRDKFGSIRAPVSAGIASGG